ncbi:DUF4145 domain-containing protein [Lelliottia nimipressuralis]|uniref:DUF4145 domain-containing protein n=2 Tax=Lelliottia nimipressuralis TaxID=69220 RepID=A0ABD4KFJ4_9ENTR|nr:DUF4145 domain-containing protein [Lelliottia nimipressuralis]
MSWVCPHCNTAAIVKKEEFAWCSIDLKSGDRNLTYLIKGITCPNPECMKASLDLQTSQFSYFAGQKGTITGSTRVQRLVPSMVRERAKAYPGYIPQPILTDYQEACAIADLSPKASATLARRCLQGMIRDFWDVKADTLFNEIQAIEEKVDPVVWEAIDGVRKVGNIGAHMEKDINLIVDVSPEEADLLIEMIEMLLDDWYVARHEKQQKLQRIKEVAAEKAQVRKG